MASGSRGEPLCGAGKVSERKKGCVEGAARSIISLARRPRKSVWNSPGFSTELTHVYLALDLSPCDRPEAAKEEEQDMTIERFPLAEVGRLIAAGEITDAKTIIGLALAEKYLA